MTKTALKQNLISVIIPAYNAQNYISLAVESILNQTYKDIEVIVVNDGSTDNTLNILKNLEKTDSRLKVINFPENKGLTAALNAAIEEAEGQYMARMDADDISLSRRLEKQIKYLKEHPSVIAVGTQAALIDKDNKIFGYKKFPTDTKRLHDMIMEVMPMQHPTIMTYTKIMKKEKYEDQPTAEDVGLFMRLLNYGDFANIDEILFHYRILRNSNSFKNVKKTFKYTLINRINGIFKYGYKPSVRGVVITLLQTIFVFILPSRFIIKVYDQMRFSGNSLASSLIKSIIPSFSR